MNYVEWVLTRGAALWREREERLKERLSRSVAGKRPNSAEESTAEGEMARERTESTAEKRAEGELERLARKLTGGENSGENENAGALPAGMTARTDISAAPVRAEAGEDGAAAWLRQELGKRAPAAAAAGAAKAERSELLPQERKEGETESFSQSLERDARRYDGGFLFY